MPQVLTSLKDFNDSPEALLERPRLAAMITAVASRGTRIENTLARLFLRLLDRVEETALSIYLAFNDRGPRQIVFDAAAKVKLTPEGRERYTDLMETVRKKMTRRNNLVHGWWAISDDHRDASLLVEQRAYHLDNFRHMHSDFETEKERLVYLDGIFSRCKIEKYVEADFRRALDDLLRVEGEVVRFMNYMQRTI